MSIFLSISLVTYQSYIIIEHRHRWPWPLSKNRIWVRVHLRIDPKNRPFVFFFCLCLRRRRLPSTRMANDKFSLPLVVSVDWHLAVCTHFPHEFLFLAKFGLRLTGKCNGNEFHHFIFSCVLSLWRSCNFYVFVNGNVSRHDIFLLSPDQMRNCCWIRLRSGCGLHS